MAPGHSTTLPLVVGGGAHKVSNLDPVQAQILGHVELGVRVRGEGSGGRGRGGEREGRG